MPTQHPGRLYRLLIAVTVLVGIIYVGNAWTPSSYAITLNTLGISDAKPLLGTPRDVRSDEFFVQTPHFQTAVRSGLSDTDQISPYKETLRNFMALPTKDWSVAFKPALWGFLVLPPAYAYSLYFFLLATACFWGWHLLFRQFGTSFLVALGGTLLITFSQMFQVWWTSNAPTFAFAPWVAIAFLAPRRDLTRLLLVFAATGIWLISLLYPPFIYAEGMAMAVAIVAFRRDALRWRALVAAGVGALLATMVVYGYLHETIEVMRQSVYPGKRSLDGGSVPLSQVVNTVLPYINTIGFDPALLAPETRNACETGVLGSYLALLLACFVDVSSAGTYARRHKAALSWLGAGMLGMLAWMLLPIPHTVGHWLLLDVVPPTRLVLGFGLLFHIALVVIAPQLRYRLGPARIFAFCAVVGGAWVVRKSGLPWDILATSWFDVVIVVLLPAAVAGALWLRQRRPGSEAAAFIAAAAICNVATFGTFNPVQSARPIFDDYDHGIVGDLRDIRNWDGRGLVAMDEWRGSALTGLGIPAVNDTLMSPQKAYFAREFSHLDAGLLNQVFNRYGHVTPRFVAKPEATGDQITVPIQHYARNQRLERDEFDAKMVEAGAISSYAMLRNDDGGYDIEVAGWAPLHGVNATQRILFSGDVVPIGALREPRADVAQAFNDDSLRIAGFRAYFHSSIGTTTGFEIGTRDGLARTRMPAMLSLAVDTSARPVATPADLLPGVMETWQFDEASRTLTIVGWSHADPRKDARVVVTMPGVTWARIERMPRPDLATAFGEPWRYAGFKLVLGLDGAYAPAEEQACIMTGRAGMGDMALASQRHSSGCPAVAAPSR